MADLLERSAISSKHGKGGTCILGDICRNKYLKHVEILQFDELRHIYSLNKMRFDAELFNVSERVFESPMVSLIHDIYK